MLSRIKITFLRLNLFFLLNVPDNSLNIDNVEDFPHSAELFFQPLQLAPLTSSFSFFRKN
jgi:hypothetical protein